MTKVGTFLGVGRGFDEALDRVRKAEALGYDSVWVTSIGGRDAFLSLREYAAATERVRVGTGVLPIYSRTPAEMAQSAATLSELTGGRFVLGLGVSHKPSVEGTYGQPYERPLRDMREYLTIVLGALRDGRVSFNGDRFSTRFGFGRYQPGPVSVYISALSPKMLQLAGELADGVILWCCTPDYIRDHIVPNVAKGAGRAGRDASTIEIVAAVPSSASENPDGARQALKRDLMGYWTLPNYRAAIERAGYGDGIKQFDEAMRSGGPQAAVGAIPDAFADALGAFGDKRAVQAKVDEYSQKGATIPAVGPFSGHDGAAGPIATLEYAAPR